MHFVRKLGTQRAYYRAFFRKRVAAFFPQRNRKLFNAGREPHRGSERNLRAVCGLMRRRRMQINGRCEINGRCKTAVYFFATGSLKTDCGILGIRRRKDKIRGLPLRRDGILQAATAGEKQLRSSMRREICVCSGFPYRHLMPA